MEKKFKVIITDTLKEKLFKIKFQDWKRLDNLKRKLETNPFAGKRLAYSLFEKKWGSFRIYYIILEKILLVIIIDYTHKKEQRTAINYIIENWDEILEELAQKYS